MNQKYRYIDAVRGWAILGVLIIHSTAFGINANYPGWLMKIISNGKLGVQLFFMASALTLFMSMQGRKSQEVSPTLNFFIRRFFRIAPLYYLGVLFYLWEDGFGPRYWLGDAQHVSKANIASNFLFMHQLHPHWINSIVPGGWSISVEMSFYLLCPLLFVLITTLDRAILFLIASMYLATTLNGYLAPRPMISHAGLWGDYLYLYLPNQLQVFALGIVLYHLIRGAKEGTSRISGWVFFALLLYVGWQGLGWLLLSAFPAAVVYLMSKRRILPLENWFTCLLGKYSYGIYICHWGSLTLMQRLGILDNFSPDTTKLAILNYSTRLAILILIAGTAAAILHWIVEQPMQNYGKVLVSRLEERKKKALGVVGSSEGYSSSQVDAALSK
jgi:peptidoglycan/LPS O-acetylase OafA/YrhL